MSSTGVHDPHWQEFPEDLEDSFAELSLSSEEPDMLISPPRSPSRLDFFYEGNLDHSELEADAGMPTSRVKLAHSLFLSGTASSRDDDDEYMPPSSLPILHYTNSQTSFEDEPASPLRTVTKDPLVPDSVRYAALPHDQKVKIPSPVSHIHTRRLNYPHHGFSRSAFLHQKLFWTARHDEWLDWQANEVKRRGNHAACAQDSRNAYTGIIAADTQEVSGPPSLFRVPPSGLERDFAENVSRGVAEDVNAPIYPRVGDISALRDPYSENVDRCFFRFPLWTIHRTLYVFDMHQRASPTCGTMQYSASSGNLSSSTGTTASGYEDITLVADDEAPFDKITLENRSDQGSPSHKTLKSSLPRTWTAAREWELNWYARWELFIDLVQRDKDLQHATPPSPSMTLSGSMDDDASPPEELPEPLSPEASTFDFASEDRDGENEDEEDDDGTLVMNPMFNKTFEERYNRAVQFLSRGRELERDPRLRTVCG